MNVHVFGYGNMGRRHAANSKHLGHLVTVVDTNADLQAAAVRDGFSRGHVGKDTDAVIIATPADTHAAVAKHVRGAGFAGALFVEKPLDVSLENREFWLSWPHRTQAVGYNWRYHEALDGWKSIGRDLAVLRLDCNSDMSTWPGKRYADPILEFSHEIDLARWLRLPKEITLDKVEDIDGWDGCRLTFDSGDIITLRYNAPPSRRYEAVSKGSTYLHWPCVQVSIEHSYYQELRAFFDAVPERAGVGRAATLADGVAVVDLALQAKSWLSDRERRVERQRTVGIPRKRRRSDGDDEARGMA